MVSSRGVKVNCGNADQAWSRIQVARNHEADQEPVRCKTFELSVSLLWSFYSMKCAVNFLNVSQTCGLNVAINQIQAHSCIVARYPSRS